MVCVTQDGADACSVELTGACYDQGFLRWTLGLLGHLTVSASLFVHLDRGNRPHLGHRLGLHAALWTDDLCPGPGVPALRPRLEVDTTEEAAGQLLQCPQCIHRQKGQLLLHSPDRWGEGRVRQVLVI